ncbi:hypothetical protein ACERIT_05180 [Halopenitus sp. H-Gu1]|uniref:hypothetical protein n=1 Tax=Halopenitus sp. H-Gu1 TaxID=3242697 RepID=UPI00359D7E54
MSDEFQIEGVVGTIGGGMFLVLGHSLNFIGNTPAGTTPGKALVFAGHVVLVFGFISLSFHNLVAASLSSPIVIIVMEDRFAALY